MSPPDGYTERAATMRDIDAVVELFQDVDLALFGQADPARVHLEEGWNSDRTDLPTMTRLIFAPDGSLAAYADLEVFDRAEVVNAFIRVRPGHLGRGLGSGLIDWSESAAATLAPAGADSMLRNSTAAADHSARRMLEGRGYLRVRVFWHMRMDLPDAYEPGTAPLGVTIRPSVEGRDDRGIYEAIDEAFQTHFGYERVGFEQWWDNARRFEANDPSLILVAEEGGRIVGVSTQFRAEEIAWVGELGVRPEAQGRGIGRALLRHALADLARRGFRVAQLNVDSDNATGAPELYRSVGMTVLREWLVFEKRIAGSLRG